MDQDTELLLSEFVDEVAVTEVIRPAAIISELAARHILAGLAVNDVNSDGLWHAEPARWCRYDRPFGPAREPSDSQLLGTVQVAYGTPTRFEITVYRVTITKLGHVLGWTVDSLTDEVLGFGGLSLVSCPRAKLAAPPVPYRH